MFMFLHALFISFPVRLKDNFRFGGRHYIGDLMTHAMTRQFLCSEFDRYGSIYVYTEVSEESNQFRR